MSLKFNVGDVCRIRQWDDMAAEFGLTGSGSISCRCLFTEQMKELCGRKFTIVSMCGAAYKSQEGAEYGSDGRHWAISEDMLEYACPLEDEQDDLSEIEASDPFSMLLRQEPGFAFPQYKKNRTS